MAPRSPLFEAYHAPRYERQALIEAYETEHSCRLVVLIDSLFPHSVAPFEEVIFDANPEEDLHIILATPGGDGETALRLARQAQSRCRKLTVIVPDQAKSAGTLFVLGAHHILMGPTSDLGPIDPQFLRNDSLIPAKAIIAAVDGAEKRIQENPAVFPLHVSMLADVTEIDVQRARDSLARTESQLSAMLAIAGRSDEEVAELQERLTEPLIKQTTSHQATISSEEAKRFGLPVEILDPAGRYWKGIWRLWTKYVALSASRIYEGRQASFTA